LEDHSFQTAPLKCTTNKQHQHKVSKCQED